MPNTIGQHAVATFTSPVNGTTPIDANSVRGNDNTLRSSYNNHDADPGVHVQSSTLASRPAAGTAGRKWITADAGVYKLWYDDGTRWHEVGNDAIELAVVADEALVKGDVVSVTGFNNGLNVTRVAKYTGAAPAFGIAAEAIGNGSQGYVINTGIISDIDTNAFGATGTVLYPAATGTFTSTKPTSGTYQVSAYVLRQNSNNGALYVEFSATRIVERSDNTVSTLVLRDASGNFAAGTITANLTGNISGTAPAGTLTGTTLASNVVNSSLTSVGTLVNLTVTNTIVGSINGNAATATALATARTINGVSFNGTADITVTAAAGTLTGATLAANVLASSLTSVGTLANLTVTNPITGSVTGSSGSTTGNAATATTLQTARNINGVSFNGSADITVTAAAGTLSGSTLASGVTASSLTSVGTLASLGVSGNLTVDTDTLFVDAVNNRVGIGTASPLAKVHALGTTNALVARFAGAGTGFHLDVRSVDSSVANTAAYRLHLDYFDGFAANSFVDFYRGSAGNDGYLAFGTSGTTRATLDASGNLGLNTVTPATTLDVNGPTTLRGNVSFLADATHDIGASASARPRNVYASGDAFFADVRVGRGAGAIASNSAVGINALLNNTTGFDNSAVGVRAMLANTTGNNNIAVGVNAMLSNTTGGGNSAVGSNALQNNTTGGGNSAVGLYAMLRNTTGDNNSAVGTSALQNNTTGGGNSAVGAGALLNNTTGNNNSAVGENAMLNNTTGEGNTVVGRSAGVAVTTGASNTAIGRSAASTLTTGSRNTIIGNASNASAVDGIDQTVVGEGLTGKGDDTAFIGGVNGAYNEKNVTTWETVSDARLKRDIVDNHDGLDKINAIRVRNFTYRTPSEVLDLPASAAIDKPGVQLGVIAQEMLPECVTETSEGVKSVSTDAVLYYLINAVQQLHATVGTLKKELGR